MRLLSQSDLMALKATVLFQSKLAYGTDGVRYCISPLDGTILEAQKDESGMGLDSDTTDTDYWQPMSSGSGGASKVSILNLTNNYVATVANAGNHLVFNNTADATITLPVSADVDDGYTISIENASSFTVSVLKTGTDTLEGASDAVILQSGEFYKFTNDQSENNWKIIMKEVDAVIGTVSHFIGFILDPTDGVFYVDIFALTGNPSIDLSQYNMKFEDGSPAWRILDASVSVSYVEGMIGMTLEEQL